MSLRVAWNDCIHARGMCMQRCNGLHAISRQWEARLLQKFSHTDRETLYELLRRMSDTMDAEGY